MLHKSNPISGKSAFGTLKQNTFQSDYISNKKLKLSNKNNTNNNNQTCQKNITMSSYDKYYLLKSNNYLNAINKGYLLPYKKADLISGLYSKMDLKDVCTVTNNTPCSDIYSCDSCYYPTVINSNATTPFYLSNTIDPVGSLFGNSQCGINNYTNFLVYESPKKTTNC
jgi:hypothetical protein